MFGETSKGEWEIEYVYKPFHPWRHGYGRKVGKRLFFLMVKLIFFVEILVLSGRYVKEHAKYTVYEREIVGNEDHGEEIFGIGIDGEQKEVFWFYQYKEEN